YPGRPDISAHNLPGRCHAHLHVSQSELLVFDEHDSHIRYMRLTSNDRGYTLVEIAVGAAMIGVIGLLLYSVLNLCIVLGAKNAAINVAHQNARTAMTRMLRDLRLPAPALVLPAIPPSTRRLSQVLFRLRPQEGTVPIAAAPRTSLVFWKIGRMLPSLIMGPMVRVAFDQFSRKRGKFSEIGRAHV